jgi:hypothetical protein
MEWFMLGVLVGGCLEAIAMATTLWILRERPANDVANDANRHQQNQWDRA